MWACGLESETIRKGRDRGDSKRANCTGLLVTFCFPPCFSLALASSQKLTIAGGIRRMPRIALAGLKWMGSLVGISGLARTPC